MNTTLGAISHDDRTESDDAQMQEPRDEGGRTKIVNLAANSMEWTASE